MFNFFKKTKNRIYFDHASATPILELAKKSFVETLEFFANPASIHFEGEKSKEILLEARKKVAKFLHIKSSNIYFAASATEANNIFIKGVVEKGNHMIYSTSDHSAIVDVVESLKNKVELSNITPNKIGLIKLEDILKELKPNTKLICFSYVHSELGTIQEVRKIVLGVREFWDKAFANKNYPKIFIDASQAVKYENMDLSTLLVDGMSFGGGKIGSVPGCAVLYVNPNTKLNPIISGGGQEEGVRSGTENLAAIVALSEVLEQEMGEVQKHKELIYGLRNYAVKKLQENFSESELEIFGDTKFKHNKYFENSAPHILLLSLVDMLGEEICLRLDAKGISVSTATACSLLENSGSNFLKAIGEPIKAKETIRLSFAESNTELEIDYFIESLKEIKKIGQHGFSMSSDL